jgi:hypothetical protein
MGTSTQVQSDRLQLKSSQAAAGTSPFSSMAISTTSPWFMPLRPPASSSDIRLTPTVRARRSYQSCREGTHGSFLRFFVGRASAAARSYL